jgi:hypothetical protein
MKPITLTELKSTISTLPNNKAADPSIITYEMIKYNCKEVKLKIVDLFNSILLNTDLPSVWHQALLFPIPKPQEWEERIDRTRPIVLLETQRKLFVKIMTNRLSSIIVENNILKGGNFAGLPGSSTFDPIRILELIREDA